MSDADNDTVSVLIGSECSVILVSNTNWKYIYGEVISNKEMQSMTPVNNFRGRPFWFEKREGEAGNLVYLRVPPLGTAVVDAVYKS